MRVTEKVADPMSNAAPPTDATSMSSSRTLARITAGRPRKPSVQNRLSRAVRSVGRNGMSAPEERFMLKPAPFSATKRSPPLISCTTPATTSPIVGAGVVQEIKGGDLFVAEKGAGGALHAETGADIPFLP